MLRLVIMNFRGFVFSRLRAATRNKADFSKELWLVTRFFYSCFYLLSRLFHIIFTIVAANDSTILSNIYGVEPCSAMCKTLV